MKTIRSRQAKLLLPLAFLLLTLLTVALAGGARGSRSVQAAPSAATIGGGIFTGSQNPDGTPNTTSAAPLMGAQVMVQNQHSGGAVVTYGTVTGNAWTATVPAPGDYVVMFSAPGHDATSREFSVEDGDVLTKDAFLPPLPLPTANLMAYSFYDNQVNGEDDAPDDPPLNGVTWTVSDESGTVLATGVSGSQSTITLPGGTVITETDGLYYFTGLPPGELLVTSDPSTVYLASNPGFSFDPSSEFYLMSSEEGGPAWEVFLYPGDPGTEAEGYLIWHGYVEKLGQFGDPSNPNPYDPGTAGSISGTLIDADTGFEVVLPGEAEEDEEPLVSILHPGVTANERVADGFIVLSLDHETVATHPVATTEADPVTGEYEFLNVPPGTYKMFVSDIPIDYVWVLAKAWVQPGTAVTVDPWVPRFWGRAQGYVYDNSTDPPTPIVGAKVHMRLKDGSIWKEEITDATGWYNFDNLAEVEVLGYVDVEQPDGYRGAMITDTFYPDATYDDTCDPSPPGPPWPPCVDPGAPYEVTHNAMNRYVQWYTANYAADLYLEPIPEGVGDIGGFVFNDHLAPGTWVGDGVYDEEDERTFQDVTVELWDATESTLLATTTTGEFDRAAILAQGWRPPYTIPRDEWGGVFVGPMPGYYEFRDLVPGDYKVKVIPLAGFAPSPAGSEVVSVTVTAGARNDVDFGINTMPPGSTFGVPLAGEIEGGVWDDLNIDEEPLSLLYEEKAGIPHVPVGVYDHLGYNLGVGFMGHPWCYDGSTICPPGEAPIQKPELEKRFASGVHLYLGNDPDFPGFNPCYTSLLIAYSLGQGKYKFEADWSLFPDAYLPGGGWHDCSDPIPAILPLGGPVINNVAPGDSYVITGSGFGDEQGHSTVTLSGKELPVKSWTDTEIHVADAPSDVSGPVVVTTSVGPSNGVHLDTGFVPAQSVFVDASNTGPEDGSEAHPWSTITEALDNLPPTTPRYVFVAPATYYEHVHIKESNIQIIGAGPLETTIDGLSSQDIAGASQGFSNGEGPMFYIGVGGGNSLSNEDTWRQSVEDVMISGFTITGGGVAEDARAGYEIGGGIFADYGNRNIDINNNVIVRNGGYYGGGIWLHLSNHDVNIWSNTIAENGNFGGYAGAISVNDEPFYPEHSDLRDTEEHGEPEHVWDDHNAGPPPGTYAIYNNHIYHNFSPDYGGGISLYEVKDHLNIFGNVIEENWADDHGGGAFFEDTGPIDIHENKFLGNFSRDDGGAISFEDVGDDISLVKVYNNLLAENIADDCGENHARGGALAFDDTFYAEVYNNTIVNNIVAGSFDPAGGGIDSERHGHEYNGSEVDIGGREMTPGFSDVKIYNNIIWGNTRLHYDQPPGGDEEDYCRTMGINYQWTPDNLHVDNPDLQPEYESYGNSESFTHVEYNDLSEGEYSDRVGNVSVAPLFVDASSDDWHLAAGSPVIDQAPACNAPRTDLDGLPRSPKDGMIDVGAYEFQWPHPASITIIKDAGPDDGTDFSFEGDLGCFTLDDAVPDDGDSFTDTITYSGLSVGAYEITEATPSDWDLLRVQCSSFRGHFLPQSASSNFNGDAATSLVGVAVILEEDENVTCTFSNVGPPEAPTNLTATVVSDSQVDLNWTDNSHIETGFRLERATDAAFTEGLMQESLAANAVSFSDTGAAAGTTYFFRVFAVNAVGDSAASNVAEVMVAPPAAPTGLVATVVSESQVDLDWTDNSHIETGFRLERATDAAFTEDLMQESLAADAVGSSDTGVVAGTTYYYRVFAVNIVGDSEQSNVAAATTPDPAPASTPTPTPTPVPKAAGPDDTGDPAASASPDETGEPAAFPNTGGGSPDGPSGSAYVWLAAVLGGVISAAAYRLRTLWSRPPSGGPSGGRRRRWDPTIYASDEAA